MEGRRVHPEKNGQLNLTPGDYGRTVKGTWWVFPPRGSLRVIDSEHVTEHEDGAITVSTPISNRLWKGRLTHGKWQPE